MKTKRFIGALICAVLTLPLTGCPTGNPGAITTASPIDSGARLQQVIATATFTLNSISNARDAGLITQAEIDKFKPAVDAFFAAKSAAVKEYKSGDTATFSNAISQVTAAAGQLAPLLTLIDQRVAKGK